MLLGDRLRATTRHAGGRGPRGHSRLRGGSWQGAHRSHARTHTRTRGGRGPGPMHATARWLHVHTDTRVAHGGGSHTRPLGPFPQSHSQGGRAGVEPPLPPPATTPGLFGFRGSRNTPCPGGVHTLPTRVPSWKNPEKARLSLGALRAPPPWDQEHSSLQGPELAADTPGVPTAPGRTGMRAGGGVQPRKLPPQASAPLPPPSPQPRTAGSQVQEPSLRGREGLPRRVRACLGRESGRVSSMCPYARPARPRPAHLWVGQLHWHQRLEVVGFPPQTTPQAARPRGSGSHPAPWQSGQQVPSREHPALESRGSSSPSRLRVWH